VEYPSRPEPFLGNDEALSATGLVQPGSMIRYHTRLVLAEGTDVTAWTEALKQALASSNLALEATQAGFEVGTRTSVDVLISLRETYRTQRDYAGARYQYLLNKLRLKQAAGILTDNDLLEVNNLLTQ